MKWFKVRFIVLRVFHLFVAMIGILLLALSGCAALRSGKRTTNMEVRFLTQSCFFGEIVPCG